MYERKGKRKPRIGVTKKKKEVCTQSASGRRPVKMVSEEHCLKYVFVFLTLCQIGSVSCQRSSTTGLRGPGGGGGGVGGGVLAETMCYR